jgi:hypothetical protein
MHRLRSNLTNGVTKTLSSVMSPGDDILTDFNEGGHSYFIELSLPGFPAQGAAAKLDLANSFIDFTSDAGFAAGQTTSVAFNASLNSLTAGGDLTFRINRNTLTNVTLTNLVGVRLRLRATGGNFTFVAAGLRLVRGDHAQVVSAIDTRLDTFGRSIPRTGVSAAASESLRHFFSDSRPQNGTVLVKFNSGTSPVSPAANYFSIFVRHIDTGDYLRVLFEAHSTDAYTTVLQKVAAGSETSLGTSSGTNVLTANTDYFLQIEFQGDQIRASIYKANGLFPGALVETTGWLTVNVLGRGYVGFYTQIENYSFTIDHIGVSSAGFATFESTPFESITPVIGATLFSHDSANVNLTEGATISLSGDATITAGIFGGKSSSTRAVRTGAQWFGGIELSSATLPTASSQAIISGELYPLSTRGILRAALLDADDRVVWLSQIPNVVANQWNTFSIPLHGSIPIVPINLLVHQRGYYNDTFYVRNVKVEHASVAWEASADAGTNWQPFLYALDSRYTGLRFLTAGTKLKVRAVALSDQAWIQGYQLLPHYSLPGHE